MIDSLRDDQRPGDEVYFAADVMSDVCPSRRVLDLIADKWTMLVLPALHQGPWRISELMRAIGGVSQKMLTQTLRELERNGFIERRDPATGRLQADSPRTLACRADPGSGPLGGKAFS
jgi:DNA-binding HxlR family transcriptional regulator